MTSKISFFNLCRENLKRRIWLLVLSVLVFFVSMPLAMMIALQNVAAREITEERCLEIFSSLLGMGFNSVLAAGFAILCAVAGFSWLFSKKKVDLYHSLPVRRETIFAACYVNGILLYLIPYLVSCLICLMIISRYLTLTGNLLSLVGITIGVNILFFLFFYNLMLAAVMLTGNMLNCLLTGGVLFVYAIAVRGLLSLYLMAYINTYYGMGNILEEMRFTSPLMAILYFVDRFVSYDDVVISYATGGTFALYLLQCAVLMALAGVIALLLYKKRPSEAAGKSIAFVKILNLYRILLVIPLSLGSGIFFEALVDTNSDGVGTAWMIFGLIFGLVLSHGFIEVLFQMDIRGMFSYKKQLLATAAVVFLLAFSIRGDWYGISSSMPKWENVSSMAVYIPSLSEGYSYVRRYKGEEVSYSESDYCLETMELINPLIYEFAEKGNEFSNQKEQDGEAARNYYVVKYNLKNGRKIYRQYWLDKKQADSYLEEIYNSQEYKEAVLEKFRGETVENLVLMDIYYANQMLDNRWVPEFLEIYFEEYEMLTLKEAAEGGVAAVMDFDCTGSTNCRARDIPIYAACTRSLQFLEEHGIDTAMMTDRFAPERISKIKLNVYDLEQYGQLTEKALVEASVNEGIFIEDRETIEKLAPYLRSNFIQGVTVEERESGISAYVWLENEDKTEATVVEAYFRQGAPFGEIDIGQ